MTIAENIAKINQTPSIDVDELASTPASVWENSATIDAIDDLIYYVSAAFGQSNHDVEKFVKTIKMLSREQYIKRDAFNSAIKN